MFKISPEASTTSRERTYFRVDPYLKVLEPEAFVAIDPPKKHSFSLVGSGA